MESPKPKTTWKMVLFPIIGLTAFFLYIYLFHVDIPAIIATAQTADPLPYVLAIAFSILEIFFFAVSWRVLLNFLQIKLSIIRAYLFVWYGIFLDIIIPAESVSGEAVRIYLIQREQGINSCGPSAASLVMAYSIPNARLPPPPGYRSGPMELRAQSALRGGAACQICAFSSEAIMVA